MIKKEGWLFLIAFSILFLNYANASCIGGYNDTILRLKNVTESFSNCHGAIYNDNNYFSSSGGIPICYSDVFQTSAIVNPNRDCSANNANLILKLSNYTNAHARNKDYSDANDANYPIKVCYENLACFVKKDVNDCPVGTKCLVALSSNNTNAHLSTCSGNLGNYFRVCCSNTGELPIVKWKDSSGNEVSKIKVGANATSYAKNLASKVNFSVYNSSKSMINQKDNIDAVNMEAIANYTFNLEGTYYFIAFDSTNASKNRTSENLIVSKDTGNCNYNGTCDSDESCPSCSDCCTQIVNSCKQFKDQTSCEGVSGKVLEDIKNSIESKNAGKQCGQELCNCSCSWEKTNSTCIETYRKCSNPIVPQVNYFCGFYDYAKLPETEDSYRYKSISTLLIKDSSGTSIFTCNSNNECNSYPGAICNTNNTLLPGGVSGACEEKDFCESKIIEIPKISSSTVGFFSFANLVFSVIIIAVFYFLKIKRKNE